MLQGSCPLWAAPFLTLHIPEGGNFYDCFQRLSFSIWRWHIEKKEEQPSRLPLSKNVLCYIETELNSAPMRCIAATIFFVVFSPGNAAPLLYCLILLSLMPAY